MQTRDMRKHLCSPFGTFRRKVARLLGRRHQTFPVLTKRLASKESVFKAPPLTEEIVDAIRLISPHFQLSIDEESRGFWEMDQNGSCWGEFEALSPILKTIPKPSKVLEIGPGLGRSVVFFTKKLDWSTTEFHLYEGNGDKTKYTILGPRCEDSFCGNIAVLRAVLEFNEIKNFKIFDAANVDFKLKSLRDDYDVIYSFYGIGFHWSLDHFMEEILGLMHEKSLAFFTVPDRFVEFERLRELHYRVISWQAVWPENKMLKMLVLSKSDICESAG